MRIADSQTRLPVPFALVMDNVNKKGTITDENGLFALSLSDTNHLFFATSIGYDTTYLKCEKTKDSVIFLSQRPIELPIITIHGSLCQKSAGYTRKKGMVIGSFNFSAGCEIAVFMANSSQDVGTIKKIKFYVCKNGFPETKFRAKLLCIDSVTGTPAGLLVNKDIILSADESGGKWVEADVTNLNIQIPAKGFFVAMEWLPDSKRYTWGDKKNLGQGSGQALGSTKPVAHCETWVKGVDYGWIKFSSYGNSTTWSNAMIGAELSVICDNPDSPH